MYKIKTILVPSQLTLNNGSLANGSVNNTFLTSLRPNRPIANCLALSLVL